MLRIEFGLVLLALLIAFFYPSLGSQWFEKLERRFAQLSRRRVTSIILVGVTALVLRAAVLRIDPATGALVRRIAVGGSPTGLAADGRSLWVADGPSVVKIAAGTNRVVARTVSSSSAPRRPPCSSSPMRTATCPPVTSRTVCAG